MQIVDSKERYYMKEITRFLLTKSTEALGATEGTGKKSTDLPEIKKCIDGAVYDEPRVMRALDHMVQAGVLEKTGFRWVTTPKFSGFMHELEV